MSFVFKNKELGDWVYSFLDKSSVQKQIERQWGDGSGAVALSTSEGNKFFCETQNDFSGTRALLTISKKELLHSLDYKPDQWNPYPEVTPPSEGWYLVTLEDPECGGKVKVEADWYHPSSDNWGLNARQRVRAFRAFPKPYEEEKKSK